MVRKIVYSSLVALLLFGGCGENSETTETVENKVPIVNADADKTVTVNKSIRLNGTATDSDGVISFVEWRKGTEVLASTLSFSYMPTVVGVDILTLIATDNDGATASDSLSVIVTEENSEGIKNEIFE